MKIDDEPAWAVRFGEKMQSCCQKDTENVGEWLGKNLRRGDVVLLYGEMGVGKTEFAKGVARGLGVTEYVTSPTFVIVNEYEGRAPLFHFDVYRLENEEELYEIGFEEYLSGRGVVMIEWPSLAQGLVARYLAPDARVFSVRIIKERDVCGEDEGSGKASGKAGAEASDDVRGIVIDIEGQ